MSPASFRAVDPVQLELQTSQREAPFEFLAAFTVDGYQLLAQNVHSAFEQLLRQRNRSVIRCAYQGPVWPQRCQHVLNRSVLSAAKLLCNNFLCWIKIHNADDFSNRIANYSFGTADLSILYNDRNFDGL
jgi:hypothetical protein